MQYGKQILEAGRGYKPFIAYWFFANSMSTCFAPLEPRKQIMIGKIEKITTKGHSCQKIEAALNSLFHCNTAYYGCLMQSS